MPEVAVRPGRKPEVQVAPPSVERDQPMSVPPPLKKRPTWKADTIVEPLENVSGSTSVACWLVVLANGSLLIFVIGTFAFAAVGSASARVAAMGTNDLSSRPLI